MTDTELREQILNEGSIPRRAKIVDDLAELMYRKGFKEAEQYYTTAIKEHTERKETEARLDERDKFQLAFKSTIGATVSREEKDGRKYTRISRLKEAIVAMDSKLNETKEEE